MQLAARGLSFSWREGSAARELFRELNFELSDVRCTAILGPSGCGKTTLLKLIAGILAPAAGEITIGEGGDPIRFGYVPQESSLLPWLSVGANMALGDTLTGQSSPDRQVLRTRLASQFGLDARLDQLPNALSGGMKQRAALANAMSSGASVLLLDEPFAGSDQTRKDAMYAALRAYVYETRTGAAIMTTHNPADVVRLADSIILLSDAPGQASVMKTKEGWTHEERERLIKLMLGDET